MSDVETALATADAAEAPVAPAHAPAAWIFLLAFINVLWAGSAIPAKLALTAGGGIGPCTLAFSRFAPASLLLYLVLRVTRQPIEVKREDRGAFMVIGIFGLAVTYLIFYTGMRGATATDSTLLIATEPVLTALMAFVLLREQLKRIQSIGLFVGFVGAYVIVCQGLKPVWGPSVASTALVAFALWFESFASVVGKRLAGRYPGLVVLTVEMLVGSAALLPFAVWEIVSKGPGHLTVASAAGLGYLAFVCSFFCYGVWFWLLPRMNVSRMAGFLFIQPMMGPLYSHLFLHERLTLPSAVGALFVVAGVWLVAVDHRRQNARAVVGRA